MDGTGKKVLARSGKILYITLNLIERALQALLFLLDKSKALLRTSFDGDNKMKTGVDDMLAKARNMIEKGMLEKKASKVTIDKFINKKFDEIIFFRNLTSEFPFPNHREKQLKDMGNDIFDQLVVYSELQKGNSKAKVALIGGFSSGKSTIINSFLREEICPSKPGAATSSVTKFYYSDERRITLGDKEIAQEQYVEKVQHIGSEKKTETYLFEYGYNDDIFNSIMLYDTPGFDNGLNTNDEKVTENILQDVDVVIYIIDINKGTVDKKDIERLNRLKKEKNKKFYCIMNKAEGKTSTGIETIKKEVERFGIFDIIIPYSAKNVLDASSRYSIEKFLDDMKAKIYSKNNFESVITGEKYKAGRKNKDRYRLHLGTQKIDDKDIDSIIQRWELKNILTNISTQKQQILQDSFDENEKRYKARAEILLKDILSEIDTYPKKKKNSEFENKIEEIFNEAARIEKARERAIKIGLSSAYTGSLYKVKVDDKERSYLFYPYYKIGLRRNKFIEKTKETIEKYEEIIDFIKERVLQIEKIYGQIEFEYPKIDREYMINKFLEAAYYSESDNNDDDLDYVYFFKPDFLNGFYGGDEIEYFDNASDANEMISKIKKRADKIIDNNMPEDILLTSTIKKSNNKSIDQKTGMLKQDDAGKRESKEQVKEKIKNYIKGEVNA